MKQQKKEVEKISGMGIQGAITQSGQCIKGRMIIRVGEQLIDTGAC